MYDLVLSLTQVWIRLVLIAIVLSSGFANSSDIPLKKRYQVPTLLMESRFNHSDDLISFLAQKEVKQQIRHLSNQLITDFVLTDSPLPQYQMALLSVTGQYSELVAYINKQLDPMTHSHYMLNAQMAAKLQQGRTKHQVLQTLLGRLTDRELYLASQSMNWQLSLGRDYLKSLIEYAQSEKALNTADLLNLIENLEYYWVYDALYPLAKEEVEKEIFRRFIIDTDVVIKTPDGVELSAVVVRKRGQHKPLPTAMQFTIYANEKYHISNAIHAVSHGYNAVIANTRGKRLSNNPITPWQYDGEDANRVIDWISHQSWSDKRVVMYGGSYNGFTQWAAAKHLHPALKAIAPYTAASPITGLPVTNNIFLTPNYEWYFFVTNNKTMDDSVYADRNRWQNLKKELFTSGKAFNQIDQIDGTPNPWFQTLLKHPSYDRYYQAMLPWKEDYKAIDIPVLTVTGYFDPGQVSALDFLNRHFQYHDNPDHTLLIGPYSHYGAQGKANTTYSNVTIDEAALQKDTERLTFQWFDHILNGKPKPLLLKNKFNYQLMGSNQWFHASSVSEVNHRGIDYFLSAGKGGNQLVTTQSDVGMKSQTVDLTERETQHNLSRWAVIHDQIPSQTGIVYRSKAFSKAMEYTGAPTGYFDISINKKDVDLGFTLYEESSTGEVFRLARYIGRASYANDMSQRQLLVPNDISRIPLVNGQIMSKVIEAGSRITLVVDVNKNEDAQVNMGTGKDVSSETVADGVKPLIIHWHNSSKLHLPITPYQSS